MRWAQLAFVESDPGGCVAFYPTKIPFHYRSAWLKDMDAFGEMAAGCRKLGMVVARTDPHSICAAAAAAYPE